jgi:Nuclease-related domain
MQILQVGGDYGAARRHKRATTHWIVAGSGAAGIGAVWVGLHPLAGAVLGVAIASIAAKAHKRLRRLHQGNGEARVAELLQSLPDDYFLLNDVVGDGSSIDHVVIGPCGVVVIETSAESHGHPWRVDGGRYRSISKPVKGGAIAVRETLSRAHPDLMDSVLRFIDSVAVFTNPTSQVKVDRAPTTVVRYSQLLDVILAKARRRKVPATVAALLAATLANLPSRRLNGVGDGPEARGIHPRALRLPGDRRASNARRIAMKPNDR